MNIIEALRDRRLFGALPAYRDLSSWARWLVFLKAMYGLPLTEAEAEIYREHTGRTTYDPPPGGWKEVVCIVGRQSGKSRVAATIAAYEAITATREADGTDLYALIVAQDQRAALRTLLSYARAPFRVVPALIAAVNKKRETADTVPLETGVTLSAYPCRPAAVRGTRAVVAVCDELAYFRSTENIPADTEMLRALRPTLATTGGRLVILSSPYGQAGALWDLHRQHFGKDGDLTVLVWQGAAGRMNPTLPADYLARMAQDDPEAYRREVLGEFSSGVATLFDPEALEACVANGTRERPPEGTREYVAFVDPSGGRRDRFALAIAHQDDDGRAVLDLARTWQPPFNPSGVVAEISAILSLYGVGAVVGDRYAGEFVAEQFRAHGIVYESSAKDKSTLYLEMLSVVNAEQVSLLDLPALMRELRGLERRRGATGKDRVDHRPGEHDDQANSSAGAVLLALGDRGAATPGPPSAEEMAAIAYAMQHPLTSWTVPADEIGGQLFGEGFA